MKYNDDPRVLFAAERTLLAWQRSAVALMGFGFVIERFGLFVTLVLHEDKNKPVHSFSLGLGIVLLLLAATVALISARQFRVVIKDLTADAVPDAYWTNVGVVMNILIAVIAALLVVHLLWSGP
jgi:putative membrane protein